MKFAPSQRILFQASGLLLAFLFLETLVILLALHFPGVPYNIRELFGSRLVPWRAFLFSLLTVWLGAAPALVGCALARRPWLSIATPLFATLAAFVSYCILRLSVTIESMLDVLGSRIWGWPGNWERLTRFWALHSPLALFLTVFYVAFLSTRRDGGAEGLRRFVVAFLFTLPWIVLCTLIVFRWPSTDNLVELVRAAPSPWVGPTLLTALLALLSCNAAWLAALPPRDIGSAFRRTLVSVAMVVPGWCLLYGGMEPAVQKYGITFPAIRFVLGASRTHDIGWDSLFLRWGVVQLGAVGCLALGGWLAMRLFESGEEGPSVGAVPRAAPRPTPHTPGAASGTTERTSHRALSSVSSALAVLFLAVMAVGLYAPTHGRDLDGSLWHEFFWVALRKVSPRDILENFLLALPAGFCIGIRAYLHGRERSHAVFLGLAAVGAVALPLEMWQAWMPPRHPSVVDVAALIAGGASAAWLGWSNGARAQRTWGHVAAAGSLAPWSLASLWVAAHWVPEHLRLSRNLLLRGLAPLRQAGPLDLGAFLVSAAGWTGVFTLLGPQLGARGSFLLLMAAWGGQICSPGRGLGWEELAAGTAAWITWAATTARGNTRWGLVAALLASGIVALRVFGPGHAVTADAPLQLLPLGELIAFGKLPGLRHALEASVLVVLLFAACCGADPRPRSLREGRVMGCFAFLLVVEIARVGVNHALPGTTTLVALWIGARALRPDDETGGTLPGEQ